MITPQTQPNISDIISLYTALIDDAANTSTRRQTVNNIYIGVNGLFLTALGFLLISSHLNSWWVVAATTAIALAVTPLNRAWLQTLRYYERLLSARYQTMREIEIHHQFDERLFGTNNDAPHKPPLVGQAFMVDPPLAYKSVSRDRLGTELATSTTLEIHLPRYFLWLYPMIAFGTANIVLLITLHILPSLSF